MLLTPELIKVIEKASTEYSGDLTILESAIGALIIGRTYGWKVLRLMHGGSAYARYQRILQIKFRDTCPERTELSKKSVSLKIVDEVKDFWGVADGVLRGRGNVVQ